MKCSYCGHKNLEDELHCVNCGMMLKEASSLEQKKRKGIKYETCEAINSEKATKYSNYDNKLTKITSTADEMPIEQPVAGKQCKSDNQKIKIFLSYSSQDKSFARKLYSDLESYEIDVWIDEADLEPGDSLVERIAHIIANVDYICVILSPSSVQSSWVRKELSLAMSFEIKGKNIEVIPLLYKSCDIPPILGDKLYEDFTQPEQYNTALKNLLKKFSHKKKDEMINLQRILAQFDLDKKLEILDRNPIKTSFSTLYKVIDTTSRERKLLKKMKKEIMPILISDFKDLNIDAENISMPLKQWEDDEYYYELLEFIDGWTLEEIINLNNGNVLGELLTSWTQELLKLLIPLQQHDPQLVHRDFRPSNIFVRKDNLNLVLIDCSSMVQKISDKRYKPIGAPGYTPPEVIRGCCFPSSDIYSLGCIIFRMNTGKHPPTITQIVHFNKSMQLFKAEYEVYHIFKKMVALDYCERFNNAITAFKNMKPPEISRVYVPLPDFYLPDGRIIKQGGWFE